MKKKLEKSPETKILFGHSREYLWSMLPKRKMQFA